MEIKNAQKISHIEIKTKTHNFCPIGKDWYTGNITIALCPTDTIPDYIDVDNYINKNINSKQFIIEDVVSGIFNHIKDTYAPKYICVTVNVNDAKHSEVTICKEEGKK